MRTLFRGLNFRGLPINRKNAKIRPLKNFPLYSIYIRIQLHLIGLCLTTSQTLFTEKEFFSHAHCVNYLIFAKLRLPSGTQVWEITGHAQFSLPLFLEITSFEVAEIIRESVGSKGQYTLSCIHLLLIEFWSRIRSYGPLQDPQAFIMNEDGIIY